MGSDTDSAKYPAMLIPIALAGLGVAVGVLRVNALVHQYLVRHPTARHLTPKHLGGKCSLVGKVTAVGDGDNFRLYHMPGGRLAGWGLLRHAPRTTKLLKGQTLHIRIAGIDAPERGTSV